MAHPLQAISAILLDQYNDLRNKERMLSAIKTNWQNIFDGVKQPWIDNGWILSAIYYGRNSLRIVTEFNWEWRIVKKSNFNSFYGLAGTISF
jgi:hypothetical protein